MPDMNGNPTAGDRDAQGRMYFPGLGWSGGGAASFAAQGAPDPGQAPPNSVAPVVSPPPPITPPKMMFTGADRTNAGGFNAGTPTPSGWQPLNAGRGPTTGGWQWGPGFGPDNLNGAGRPGAGAPGAPPGAPGQPPFQFDPTSFGSTGQFKLDPAVEQAYRFALQQAMQRYQDPNASKYYSGQTVAQLTPDEQAAQGMVRGQVPGMQGMVGDVGNYYQSLLQQPGQANPALEAAINAMRSSATKSFQDPGGPMSAIRQDAQGSGQYGGTRQGIAEGLAMGRLGDSLTSNEANMRYQDLGAQYARASGAAGALPSYLSSAMAPAAALAGVGAQNRDITQQGYNSDMNKWAYETSAPDTRLQNLLNMIGGTTPIGGTNYSQSYSPSWYTDMLKAGGGAAGGSGNNWLAALAAAGGLYGLLK